MPFRSQHQWAWAFAAENRGELPRGTAALWAHESRPFAALPATAGAAAIDPTVPTIPPAPALPPAESAEAPTGQPRPTTYFQRRSMNPWALVGVFAGMLGLSLGIAHRWGRR